MSSGPVQIEVRDGVAVVTITRPEVRNAVDDDTAEALASSFENFEADGDQKVAILTGAGGTFCAGADLKAVARGQRTKISPEGIGPMGPTRMLLTKPVIAAVEGYAVAGGLELALWCDIIVAARDSIFGVFSRRFGVPLIDGGTIRLPRAIGQARALDMILTGREVGAEEARSTGLVQYLADPGEALTEALAVAQRIASLPQVSLRADRTSVYEQWGLDLPEAIAREFAGGTAALTSGETIEGAERFDRGEGRHGRTD